MYINYTSEIIFIFVAIFHARKYREISIALGSKCVLCAVRWRRLIRGETDLEICADLTVCEYIPRIHAGSQVYSPIVRRFWLNFLLCVLNVCISVNCIMDNKVIFSTENVYLCLINIY